MNLKLNLGKYKFTKSLVRVLGYIVGDGSIWPDPSKVSAIKKLQAPNLVKEIRLFLGMVNFYRRFIKDCSTISKPLSRLTKKDVPLV